MSMGDIYNNQGDQRKFLYIEIVKRSNQKSFGSKDDVHIRYDADATKFNVF